MIVYHVRVIKLICFVYFKLQYKKIVSQWLWESIIKHLLSLKRIVIFSLYQYYHTFIYKKKKSKLYDTIIDIHLECFFTSFKNILCNDDKNKVSTTFDR